MGWKIETTKVLVWDDFYSKMIAKTKVNVSIVTNRDTVIFSAGPIYCIDGLDILEAVNQLKNELLSFLPEIASDHSNRII